MINNTKRIKELYEEIQRQIFYAVPGNWDELYLYASIIDRLGKIQTGEMYFYFLPKGLLKRKFINVYEVPRKYDIEEEEYLKLVDLLYKKIKELREEFIKTEQPIWSSITISIKNNIFKIEYDYKTVQGTQEAYYDHHIYWRKKYLKIEPHSKKEKEALENFRIKKGFPKHKKEEYSSGIYLKRKTNIVTYDTLDFKKNQRVEYLATEGQAKKIRNQILCNK